MARTISSFPEFVFSQVVDSFECYVVPGLDFGFLGAQRHASNDAGVVVSRNGSADHFVVEPQDDLFTACVQVTTSINDGGVRENWNPSDGGNCSRRADFWC